MLEAVQQLLRVLRDDENSYVIFFPRWRQSGYESVLNYNSKSRDFTVEVQETRGAIVTASV